MRFFTLIILIVNSCVDVLTDQNKKVISPTQSQFEKLSQASDNESICLHVRQNSAQNDYKYTDFIIVTVENLPMLIMSKNKIENGKSIIDCSADKLEYELKAKDFLSTNNDNKKKFGLMVTNITQFLDNNNTGRYESGNDKLFETLLAKNLSWTIQSTETKIKKFSVVLKGMEQTPKFFNDKNGYVSFSITIHPVDGLQETAPRLPVKPGTVSVKIEVVNFKVDSHSSRLLTQLDFISEPDVSENFEVISYVNDMNLPGIFESKEIEISQSGSEGYIGVQMKSVCFTSEKLEFFSKVKMEKYSPSEIKISATDKSLNETYPSWDNFEKLHRYPLIYSCGQHGDNGYKYTNYVTFAYTIMYDVKIKQKTNQKGLLISFLIVGSVSAMTIIISMFKIRKQATTLKVAEQNLDDEKMIGGPIPPVQFVDGP